MRIVKPIAAMALAVCLTGAAASPDEPYPGHGRTGPTCYGANYSYHVWNLIYPQDVFGIDSCTVAVLVAERNVAGNYAMYVSLVAARVPQLIPASVTVMLWQTSNVIMASCASHGTGIEMLQDGRTGWMLLCSAQ